MKTAVYIGRFQPVHDGHIETIKQALNENDQLIILIGSYNRLPTIKNPFDVETRKELLTKAIMDAYGEKIYKEWTDFPFSQDSVMRNIDFGYVRDYLYNDYKWLSEVYNVSIQLGATDDDSTTLYGCKKDESSYYLDMFPRWNLNTVPYFGQLDSTDIRNEIFNTDDLKHDSGCSESVRDYLLKWVGTENYTLRKSEFEYYRDYQNSWSSSPFTPIHNTTDSIVIRSGCVLLIKRKFPNDVWALAGGFLDPSERIKDGAIRELKEETRIKVTQEELKKSIVDYKVFDHPERSLRGRVITHCFLIDLGNGHMPSVKGDSDASGAVWVPIADVMKMEDKLFEDHYDIIVNMISKY